MPIIDADFKQLEILCAGYLSKDQVLYHELRTGHDIHTDNQTRFNLPTRDVAKIFIFRLIYGGTEYSYARDPDFTGVSTSTDFWKRIIGGTYDKYKGLHRWHREIVQEVVRTGRLIIPSGRVFTYKRMPNGEWPRTTILNYPVQGLGADIMSVARVSLYKRLKKAALRVKLISTVHDSIVLDSPEEEVDAVAKLIFSVWDDIPRNFERAFGSKLDLPCKVEVKVGENWGDMHVYKRVPSSDESPVSV